EFVLVIASLPPTADVIANAGTAPLNGAMQHSDNGAPERVRLRVVNVAAQAGRVQAGLKQRFVGVDIAYAGHDALVEQDRLERAVGLAQALFPVVGVQLK